MSSVSTPSKANRVATKLTSVTLAGPGAVTILGEFNSKLDLSAILTRVVVNFRHVTHEFWMFLLARLPFKVEIDTSALTVFTLVIVPTLFQKGTLKDAEDGEFYIGLSLCFSYLICLAFSPFGPNASVFFVSVAFIVGTIDTLFPPQPEEKSQTASGLPLWFLIKSSFWLSLILVLTSLIDQYSNSLDNEKYSNYIYNFLTGTAWTVTLITIVLYYVRKIMNGAPGPLYIALVGTGIYFIDLFGRVAKPGIENWLSSVGA